MPLVHHDTIKNKNHRHALCNTIYFKEVGQHTYVPPENLAFIEVEVQAGGGGSGGAPATASNQRSASSGGGGGGYSKKKILIEDINSEEVITVGSGGAGGSAGRVWGVTGGSSSFGSHVSATGGAGGMSQLTVGGDNLFGAVGGVGVGGDLNIRGGESISGRINHISDVCSFSSGGCSHMSGAISAFRPAYSDNYGSGGGGQHRWNSQHAIAGHAGAQGIVIIHEYF